MLRARTGTHRCTLRTEILRFFSPNISQVHKPMNMVKLLLLLCLISGMSFFSEQSLADQNDPRLATLFLKLGNAETPQESKLFEKQIWQVWMEHESPEIRTKLQEGTQAMQAQDTLAFCSYSSIATNQCMAAQNTWDNAINTAWSLAGIGLLIAAAVAIKIDRFVVIQSETSESE